MTSAAGRDIKSFKTGTFQTLDQHHQQKPRKDHKVIRCSLTNILQWALIGTAAYRIVLIVLKRRYVYFRFWKPNLFPPAQLAIPNSATQTWHRITMADTGCAAGCSGCVAEALPTFDGPPQPRHTVRQFYMEFLWYTWQDGIENLKLGKELHVHDHPEVSLMLLILD